MKHLRLLWVAIATIFGLGANAQTWTADEAGEGLALLYNVGTGQYFTRGNGWDTQASIGTIKGALAVDMVLVNGNYFLRTGINNVNYGLEHLNGGTVYTDQSQNKQSTWKFELVGNDNGPVYNIISADNHGGGAGAYLTANSDNTIIDPGSDGSSDYAKWKIFNISKQKEIVKTAMSNATEDNPVDATLLIDDADFNLSLLQGSWTMVASNQNLCGGLLTNRCAESWHATFTLSQTITVPNGSYKLRAQAALADDGGTGQNWPVVYANDKTVVFNQMTGGEGNMDAMSAQFTANKYFTDFTDVVTVTDGKLTVGVKGTRTDTWAIWDNFQLQYLGGLTDLTPYIQSLATAVAAAEALEGKIPSGAYEELMDVVDENNKEYTTAEDYQTAIGAITSATEAAQALQKPYSRYLLIKAAVLEIDADLDTSAADDDVADATTKEQIDNSISLLRSALINVLPNLDIPETPGYIDLTVAMIDNPTVRENVEYWNVDNLVRAKSWGTGPTTNYNETEFYQSTFDFNQTIYSLPKGTYEFGVTGFHRAGNHETYFYAGEDRVKIPGVESSVVNQMWEAEDYFNEGNGKVALKFALVDESTNLKIGIINSDNDDTDRWTIFRDFTLHYYGEEIDLTPYQTAWQEAVQAATDAMAAYPNVTGDELTTLIEAMGDEPEETVASYQEKTNALLDATSAFISAAPSYDAYYAEKAIAEMIGVTIGDAPTTAEDAAAAVNMLKVAEFNYVETEYPFDYELVVGTFDTWEGTATVGGQPGSPNHLDDQHWSGQKHDYYEQDTNGWGNANGWTIKYEKTVTLPAGDYMLKVSARSSAEVTSSVSCTATTNTVTLPNVGAETKGIDIDGNASFEGTNFANGGKGYGWEWRFLPFSLVEETEVTMTFYGETDKREQWMSISDGTLLSKQEVSLYATADDYDALNAALAEFENVMLGFDEDEYAPYNNVEAILALEAANNIDPSTDNLRTEVLAIIEALENATVTANIEEVNAVYDGDFSLEEAHESGDNVVLPGWTTVSGNTRLILKNTETYPALTDADAQTALFVHPGTYEYGHTTGYTMPLDAGEMYVLTFKYCAWQNNSNQNFTATILDEDGQEVASKSFGKVEGGLNSEGSLKAVRLYFTPENDGNYILSFLVSGNSAFTDVKIVKAEMTDLILLSTDTEAPEEQYAGTVITDRILLQGLNTIVLPFETTKEELGAAYVLQYTGTTIEVDGLTLNFEEVETLNANVPYAVMLDENAIETLSFVNKEVTPSENLTVVDVNGKFNFVGTYVDIPKGNDTVKSGDYVAGATAFKKAKGGNRIAAYRAYLKKVADGDPTNVAFNFDGEVITGIEAVELLNRMSGDMYNLNGQKVNRTQRGIYIINGQKVVVK